MRELMCEKERENISYLYFRSALDFIIENLVVELAWNFQFLPLSAKRFSYMTELKATNSQFAIPHTEKRHPIRITFEVKAPSGP